MSEGTNPARSGLLPRQVWALVTADGDPQLVDAIELAGDPFLAFMSRADALAAAADHQQTYGIACHPVRVA